MAQLASQFIIGLSKCYRWHANRYQIHHIDHSDIHGQSCKKTEELIIRKVNLNQYWNRIQTQWSCVHIWYDAIIDSFKVLKFKHSPELITRYEYIKTLYEIRTMMTENDHAWSYAFIITVTPRKRLNISSHQPLDCLFKIWLWLTLNKHNGSTLLALTRCQLCGKCFPVITSS